MRARVADARTCIPCASSSSKRVKKTEKPTHIQDSGPSEDGEPLLMRPSAWVNASEPCNVSDKQSAVKTSTTPKKRRGAAHVELPFNQESGKWHDMHSIRRDASAEVDDILNGGRFIFPTHANACNVEDGYLPEAMLFVDEDEFLSRTVARTSPINALAWRPFVRFQSSHFHFEQIAGAEPRLIQVGVGINDIHRLNGCPPSTPAKSTAGAAPRQK